MPTDFIGARDQIYTLFKDAWDAITFIPVPPVEYIPTKPQNKITPDNSVPFVRVKAMVGTTGNQTSLRNGQGKQKYTRVGIFNAQVYVPLGADAPYSDVEGVSLLLVQVVVDAFEGKTTSGGIWFREVTPNEVGETQGYWQNNINVAFSFDQVK